MEPYTLTATQALLKIRADELTVEAYAISLLNHISHLDLAVKAWAYLDVEYVLQQARSLDAVPKDERGPLHGIPIGIKDVMYTKGAVSRKREMGLVLRFV
jgi:Asp-tRNA(Asn)/Glu-tRNA(Gln) amidotransferase A subunit family amidase